MHFTQKDDLIFDTISDILKHSPITIHTAIIFDSKHPKYILESLKKEDAYTYKKKEYTKYLYDEDVYKEQNITFEKQDFHSSINGVYYRLIEKIKEKKGKEIKKENLISHEFIFNKENTHTFIIYENMGKYENEMSLTLHAPPEISPDKIKYHVEHFYNFIKIKELEYSIDRFYEFLEKPSRYLEIPFLPIFTDIIDDGLVAYHIITTFIDIKDFKDICYFYKKEISTPQYINQVFSSLSKKLENITEIEGMTDEKIDIIHDKLKEILEIL